jgi:hypothetical protein
VRRPWLRKHQATIRTLVHDDWSWAAIAQALTRAGITWRTGRAWSAEETVQNLGVVTPLAETDDGSTALPGHDRC